MKEIYNYHADHVIYGLGWSVRKDRPFRLALGSFIEEYKNVVEIVQLQENSEEDDWKFTRLTTLSHPYPCTNIQFRPDPDGTAPKDQLATTGDYLRIWTLDADGNLSGKEDVLNSNKNSDYCAPLTSFDWNKIDPNLIVTSSIDTTCTIWDIEKQMATTQLIAHDSEVYDVAWTPQGPHNFCSVGRDGSVRMFDTRKMEHSTIIYENEIGTPLLRIAWNQQDPNYLATFFLDDKTTVILDTRVPSIPVAKLAGHEQCVNSIAWAPHSSCHICTAGNDSRALIWDLSNVPNPVNDPILAYNAAAEINQLQWSQAHSDWVAIAFDKRIQILRV